MDFVLSMVATGASGACQGRSKTVPLRRRDLTLRTVLATRADNDSPVIGEFVKAIGKTLGGRERPQQDRVILTG